MGLEEEVEERSLLELAPAECFRLLGTQAVGRLAVAVEGEEAPLVVPVNYAMDGDVIVFRSGPGTKVSQLRRRRVSFEVDEIDPFHRSGWSVLVRGYAHEATEWEVAHVAVDAWAPGERNHWVRLEPDFITGRRIQLPAFKADPRGYL